MQMGDQLTELQAEIDFLKTQYNFCDVVLSDARDLCQRWPDINFNEKRTIIETITISMGKHRKN